MGSVEMERNKETVKEEGKKTEMDLVYLEANQVSNKNVNTQKTNKKKKKKKKSKARFVPSFRCMRSSEEDFPAVEETEIDRSFNVEAGCNGKDHAPTHLIVMVNGIIGSAQNWRYAAKQFVKAYPNDVIVHCSESNSSMLTFDGVDVMGKRLADEVISVVDRHPNLQKISFVGHSLGGLVSRYAIACLYKEDSVAKSDEQNGECQVDESMKSEKSKGKIAGLEPMNFITSATPHLGSRGHKQVPMFCGFYTMEKFASRASWLLGRTGRHLFLTDKHDGKPPLLLQMANDSEDLKFISALQSFKRRVAYANARFDHLVGWSSSSLRRPDELPKRLNLVKHPKYPHVVNEEIAEISSHEGDGALETKILRGKTSDMEEAMLRNLTRLSWVRIDISFSGTVQRLLAHSVIQVKTYCINSEGADVIQHMVDNFQL